jgi:hypothetical protein
MWAPTPTIKTADRIGVCTVLKKENKFIKEIQRGSGAKSYMTKYLSISSNIRKLFLISDFAHNPF